MNGSCNNLIHPTWGTAKECYMRFQPAFFEGKSELGGIFPLTFNTIIQFTVTIQYQMLHHLPDVVTLAAFN